MTATAIQQINSNMAVPTGTALNKTVRQWTAGLFVSALLGVGAGLGGIAIGVLSLAGLFAPGKSLPTLGTILIAVSFPMFFFAAHCLDKADAADKAIRLDYCRQHGLGDEVAS